MSPANDSERPVVEAAPGEDKPDLTLRALRLRIRQQEILAELGVIALQGASFDKLLEETARLTAEGLRAEFCKVLEHIPSENRLLVRAGTGWASGVVGIATIGADIESQALSEEVLRLESTPAPAEPKAASSEPEKQAETASGGLSGDRTVPVSTFHRAKGTLFLVDPRSRLVLWSIYAPPKGASSVELDRTAAHIASRIHQDLKSR